MGKKQKEKLSESEVWFSLRLEKPLKITTGGEVFELLPGKKLTVTNRLDLVHEAQRLGAEVRVLKLIGEELIKEVEEKGYQVVTKGKKIEEELEKSLTSLLEKAKLTFLSLERIEKRKSDFKITLRTHDEDNDPVLVTNKLNSILAKLKKQGFEILLEILNKVPKKEEPLETPPPAPPNKQEKQLIQESEDKIREKLKVDLSKLTPDEREKLKQLLGEQ